MEGTGRRPTIGVALGGGGARGWAHIGVLRALERAGINPAVVAGTSMGAAVGAAYAAGRLDAFESWALELDRRTVLGLFDLSFRGGLIEASRVFEHLQDILPDEAIENLPLPFGAVSTDFERGHEVQITSGSLQEALRASIAIPGLISPSRWNGRWMVDGGLVNPVPVTLARALGADVVIAVELGASKNPSPLAQLATSHESSDPETGPKAQADFFESFAERFMQSIRRTQDKNPDDARPSVFEIIGQSLQIMQVRIARSILAGDPPDLHVVPRLQNVGLMDFDRAGEAIKEGDRAARLALAAHADFHRPEED